jgi:hypothetical protein
MNLTGNLTAGYATLNHSLKVLRALWDETSVQWNDPVGRSFQENFWDPLENRVVTALRAIDRMTPVLGSMQRDCE